MKQFNEKKTKFGLNEWQKSALALLNQEKNVFLTGVAGAGKSFLLNDFLKSKNRRKFPVVASTGAAALIVRGTTFHSFFGLGILEGGPKATLDRALSDKRVRKRIQHPEAVVIDEISMISGVALETAEKICRQVRDPGQAWGGLRIIAVGDFAQLPPISPPDWPKDSKDWSFATDAWRNSEFNVAYLPTVMRTEDPDFLETLNYVREGIVNTRVEEFLNSRLIKNIDLDIENSDWTRLYAHRYAVEDFNLQKLAELPGTEFEIASIYGGAREYVKNIKRSAPIPEILYLKKNALVMIRKNDPELGIVNGTLAKIEAFNGESLILRLLDGEQLTVQKERFTMLNADGDEVAFAENFPVNLAWASTIHKSQGMSLDRVIMDISKVFEEGQAYVALSRAKQVKGLGLLGWNANNIRASEDVKKFHREILR